MRPRAAAIAARLVLLAALVPAAPTGAAADELRERALRFFPQADAVGELAGTPPAADVYAGSRRLGVVYYSDDVAPIPAYSGHPVRMLI
ncbi:MAG: regulatory protein NosR, partial [Gammaproteobacteria bacterium]|nr:regulatory protein NosR [Gammaproteobacteria bacterium]